MFWRSKVPIICGQQDQRRKFEPICRLGRPEILKKPKLFLPFGAIWLPRGVLAESRKLLFSGSLRHFAENEMATLTGFEPVLPP